MKLKYDIYEYVFSEETSGVEFLIYARSDEKAKEISELLAKTRNKSLIYKNKKIVKVETLPYELEQGQIKTLQNMLIKKNN